MEWLYETPQGKWQVKRCAISPAIAGYGPLAFEVLGEFKTRSEAIMFMAGIRP